MNGEWVGAKSGETFEVRGMLGQIDAREHFVYS